MVQLHKLNITFSILTKGSEPLNLSNDEKQNLLNAFERSIEEIVDLTYFSNGHYGEERHKVLGAAIVEDTK